MKTTLLVIFFICLLSVLNGTLWSIVLPSSASLRWALCVGGGAAVGLCGLALEKQLKRIGEKR